MAILDSGSLNEVWRDIMSDFSSFRELIPVNKNQLRTFLGMVDAEMEASEIGLVQSLPAGKGKQWLISNPRIGREMLIRIERKRKEVL